MKGLVWFRNDIRMDDNPSLKRAFEECDLVMCVYIWSAEQLKMHNESNIKQEFLINNLILLEKSLTKLNIPLIIFRLSGIYSSENNVLNRLKKNLIKIVEMENQIFSRIFSTRNYL